MTFSDLPTPAEASVHATEIMPGLRAGGKPVPTFRGHARISGGSALLRLPYRLSQKDVHHEPLRHRPEARTIPRHFRSRRVARLDQRRLATRLIRLRHN